MSGEYVIEHFEQGWALEQDKARVGMQRRVQGKLVVGSVSIGAVRNRQ